MWFHGGHGWLGGGFIMFLFVVLGLAVLFIIFKFVFGGGFHCPYRPADPMDILKRRYANGEMTTEEFEEAKRKLKENR